MSEEAYKLRVVRLDTGELELVANRVGLRDLAEVCKGLADLTDEEDKTAANHYHIDDFMGNAEDGSIELVIRYDPDL